jgi:tRNA(Ile2) C34 agmatinyltransferase TiaS
MKNQDFLLYPLATEDEPRCPACGERMTMALFEARSAPALDLSTFRCDACKRSERFSYEN